ncbi:hypothetical protein AAIR98_000006 [Elusimicrobium simillimum]
MTPRMSMIQKNHAFEVMFFHMLKGPVDKLSSLVTYACGLV